MRLKLNAFTASFCAVSAACSVYAEDYSARVGELVARMTLDEKIGQMIQVDIKAIKAHEEDIAKYGVGSLLSGGSSDPSGGNGPESWRKMVLHYQSVALKSRLKIPLIYGIDAVHGNNNVEGAVIFPHNIGLGATRNPALVRRAAEVTAKETAAIGVRWAFAPCVAVAQDDRWGRTYESFGDTPEIAGELGAAAVRGLQGERLSPTSDSVLACAKHFVGDGGTTNGKDQGDTQCDETTLRKLHLPPYRAAIEAGVGSIMVSYSSWNKTKMHAQKYLLTDVLKGELGFKGFLISDWAAIDQINPDFKKCTEISINAGLDMIMIPYGPGETNTYLDFIGNLKELVTAGRVPMERIDDAVSRILKIKFAMGLFENGGIDPELIAAFGSDEHRQVARECVRESLVVLKNDGSALPLRKDLKHIAVLGRSADDLGMQCGGWTVDWQGKLGQVTPGGTTILAAIRQAVSPDTRITYVTNGPTATDADVVVVVIGETPYAEGKGDRKNLDLTAEDQALVKQARATGAPVVTLLLSGRVRVLGDALANSDAFVAAWLPGTEGEGVADVLFGDFAPKGRLPRSWPQATGGLPFSAGLSAEPVFRQGFGLSY